MGYKENKRKYVLQYDDVMNEQRNLIYSQRKKVLDGEDISASIMKMIDDIIEGGMTTYASSEFADDWNMVGLIEYFETMFFERGALDFDKRDYNYLDQKTVKEEVHKKALERYKEQSEIFGDMMREVERVVLLRSVDRRWMDHIDDMDQLKSGITLRSYGQHDPVMEYKFQGADMFDEMNALIREDTIKGIFHARPQAPIQRVMVAKPTMASHGDGSDTKKPVRKKAEEKIGRNDPCPCGSGKKYKNCCMNNAE